MVMKIISQFRLDILAHTQAICRHCPRWPLLTRPELTLARLIALNCCSEFSSKTTLFAASFPRRSNCRRTSGRESVHRKTSSYFFAVDTSIDSESTEIVIVDILFDVLACLNNSCMCVLQG
jgi:hypothetical protein